MYFLKAVGFFHTNFPVLMYHMVTLYLSYILQSIGVNFVILSNLSMLFTDGLQF